MQAAEGLQNPSPGGRRGSRGRVAGLGEGRQRPDSISRVHLPGLHAARGGCPVEGFKQENNAAGGV